LGLRFLGPATAHLAQLYPDLKLSFDLSDRTVDLVDGGYDMAFRAGEVAQVGLIVRKIGQTRRLVVGAPSYFEKHGKPCHPSDLKGHNCLRFTFQKTPDFWTFQHGASEERVRVKGSIEGNNGDLLADAAVHGVGVAWLPEFIVAPLVRQGRLAVVLGAHCEALLPVVLVFPERRHRPLRVRLVADALQEALEQTELKL
jgi:DNA-binding transcriptional LysR family regulator